MKLWRGILFSFILATALGASYKKCVLSNVGTIEMASANNVNSDPTLEREARSASTSGDRLRELSVISEELAQIVASNIATPPELLKALAFNRSEAVRKAVVSNPNTSTETLFVLGAYFPQELLDNPSFPLLILEDLKDVERFSSDTLASLIQQPQVPEFLLEYAANHQDKTIAYMANLNVAISGEMKAGWHEEAAMVIRETPLKYDVLDNYFDEEKVSQSLVSAELLPNLLEFIPPVILENLNLRRYIGRNPSATPAWLRQLANDSTRWIRNSVAKNLNTPIETLKLLSRDRNYMVRRDVLDNPNTPVEIIESLADDSSTEVRMWVAKNINTPIDKLQLLANDNSERVRMQVAANPNTPAEKLQILVNDGDPTVKQLAAKNPNMPGEILEFLAKNSSKHQRQNVAENISTPTGTLELLAQDTDRWVRAYVAKNPNTLIKTLELLAQDTDNSVRSYVAKNPNTPLNTLEFLAADSTDTDTHSWIHKSLAENPSSSEKILKLISTNSNSSVRENVARNPNATLDILRSLAKDSVDSIRRYVASNPSTSSDIIELLANDSDIWVRFYIAKNSNTSIEILEKLANDSYNLVRESVSANPKCTREIKETIVINFAKLESPSFSRLAFFLSNYAESSILAEHSNSISWLERYAIAQNAKTPKAPLNKLAKDSNRIVRATAKESLQKYY